MIGKSISHYRVTEKLGEGGMGVVYRATDTKLGRDVALKVLPPVFANDSERMALFQREAHVLASLNHPHIASIYGLEEADGIHCLVLELVEGPTLAERIQEGAVPLEESLKISKQIAEALEAAHEKSVIHRDLKPANVKVTPEGMVKVLDFGLAKALGEPASEAEIQNAPTQRLAATETGIILGTAAYMGPEQARGQKVDMRADIWAFGVVLFEMLTGKRTFEGQSVSDTLAAVIMREPNWEALPSGTPAPIQNLLHRCLEKDRTQRLQAIGEARITIDKYFADPAASSMQITAAPATIQPLWRRALPWAVAGLFALIAAVALWVTFGSPATGLVRPPMHLSVQVAPSEPLWLNPGPIVAISPDGTRLVYVGGTEPGPRRLYLRPIDRLVATPMSGTEGADDPFFSPDGEWVGFFAGGKLKKAFVHGGPPVTLADAPAPRGGSWGPDGSILFTPNSNAGLFRVSAAGGGVAEATTLDSENDEHSHRWPDILPGGKAVLYTTRSRREDETIYRNIDVVSLETGERKALIEGGIYGRYLPTGHIAYVWEGTLLAVPFDLGRLEVTGTPLPLLDNVSMNTGRGSAQVGFSQTGTLVYLTGERATDAESIFWMDREGKIDPLLSTPRDYSRLRFSPDGRRLAVNFSDGKNRDIWVYDLEREALSRLTFNEGTDRAPVWTPDGRYVTFRSAREGGAGNIYWKRADGTGDAERLTESSNLHVPSSWSPDGKVLAFFEQSTETGWDLWTLPMEKDGAGDLKPGKPVSFLLTPFNEMWPAFSPDGRWIAHNSNESGTYEVYVRPFPGPGGKWQISNAGGRFPTWSRNGRELFYHGGDNRIMVVNYSVEGDSFRAGGPRLWSERQFTIRDETTNFDLHPDGKRFAVLKAPEDSKQTGPTHVNLILNWFDEVRRRVASAGQN